jgi:ribosomal protein L34E
MSFILSWRPNCSSAKKVTVSRPLGTNLDFPPLLFCSSVNLRYAVHHIELKVSPYASLSPSLLFYSRGQNGCYILKCGFLLSPLATRSEARLVNDHNQSHKQQQRNRPYPLTKCESVRMKAEAVEIMSRILIKVNGVPLPMHHARRVYSGRGSNPPHNTS